MVHLDGSSTVQFDLEEVSDLSIDLLRFMEDAEVPTQMAVVALALTFGRLLAPTKPLSDDDAIKFVQACLEFGGLYFTEGRPN